MNRLLLAVTLVALAPSGALAQPERFELGRRLRAFEDAYEAQTDPAARQRAVAPLNEAVKAFFSFQLPRAGQLLDQARLALGSVARPTPAQWWAAALYVQPETRCIDPAAGPLNFTVQPFYPVEGPLPPDLTLKLTLRSNRGQTAGQPLRLALAAVPHTGRLDLTGLPEGDYTLSAALWNGDSQAGTCEVTVSCVSRLQTRLEAARTKVAAWPDDATGVDRETVRSLLRVLEQLSAGKTLETNYPAAEMLAKVETALAAVDHAQPYFGRALAGQNWLTLPTPSGKVAVRLFARREVEDGRPRPLVVALHGAGGSENLFFDGYGNGAIVKLCQELDWLLVAPRSTAFGTASPAEVVDALAKIYPVDRKRVFLVGHSMGAAQAAAAAGKQPERFAGVACLGGGGSVRKSDNLKTLPFLVGVGAEDFAVRSARGLRDGLQRAEVARVEYKEYPAIEHLLIVQVALKEVFAFFDQCPPR